MLTGRSSEELSNFRQNLQLDGSRAGKVAKRSTKNHDLRHCFQVFRRTLLRASALVPHLCHTCASSNELLSIVPHSEGPADEMLGLVHRQRRS